MQIPMSWCISVKVYITKDKERILKLSEIKKKLQMMKNWTSIRSFSNIFGWKNGAVLSKF
jgi:hypothetical protein